VRLGGAGCGVRHQGPFAIAEPRRSDAVSLRSARAALDAAQKTRGKVGVSGEESEWRRQWRQPRRKREQNSRFCGHNGLGFFADCAAKKWPLRGNATQRKQAGSSNIANFLSMYSR